jgi:hypothetical protein
MKSIGSIGKWLAVAALCGVFAGPAAHTTIIPGKWKTALSHRQGLYNCHQSSSGLVIIRCWSDQDQVCWVNLGDGGLFLNDGHGLSVLPGTPETYDEAVREDGI